MTGAGSHESSDLAEICSARGCTRSAVWAVRWNNPRLHTPDRRKIWLACDEHRASLSSFLSARGFLKDVVAHPESVTDMSRDTHSSANP